MPPGGKTGQDLLFPTLAVSGSGVDCQCESVCVSDGNATPAPLAALLRESVAPFVSRQEN